MEKYVNSFEGIALVLVTILMVGTFMSAGHSPF